MDFVLVHCNFGLRGTESDGDERFVIDLAKGFGKTYQVKTFDTMEYVETHKVSVQMAARELRYHWFKGLMQVNNIDYLVTAHHADDDIETFIINLSRGTGIKGLTGIPVKSNDILRPLMPFSRMQILSFARSKDIEWREDKSNEETKYLRNKVRHQIVPLLKELHPTFLDNFKSTQEFLYQTALIYDNHITQLKEDLFEKEGDVIRISIKALSGLNPMNAYIYGLFRDYGFTEWNDVSELVHAMSGKEVRSKTHRLIKDREVLLLAKIGTDNQNKFQIEGTDEEVQDPIHLAIRSVDKIEETSPGVLYVDKETLKYPMTLRKWEKGDYFYPLGMHGRKKLSKYFKDEKVNIVAKENQWLLCSNNDIVWVVGKRADERFKITEKTKHIVKIVLKK